MKNFKSALLFTTWPLAWCFCVVSAMAHGADNTNAAAIIDCWDGPSGIENIVEPLSENTRTYANGSIRVVHIDNGGEPACCSSYLAILAPDPESELDGRQCKLLASDTNGLGFSGTSVKDIDSSYDTVKGLLLIVPVERYTDGNSFPEDKISVRINQGAGTITLE